MRQLKEQKKAKAIGVKQWISNDIAMISFESEAIDRNHVIIGEVPEFIWLSHQEFKFIELKVEQDKNGKIIEYGIYRFFDEDVEKESNIYSLSYFKKLQKASI